MIIMKNYYFLGTLKHKPKQSINLGPPFILDKYSITYLYFQSIYIIVDLYNFFRNHKNY